ncbi:hypothetical protein OBBRIDRAFT_831551 [Obba rivulosa]|uniref:Uncharacterized protein n=1 Tax=Obba rivulosa TaxID=1052685 RepID=A0A8E2DS03_9APHY|nr:hypothetical protein OBBRIDRAFT_831551 [Obba rivulosa]
MAQESPAIVMHLITVSPVDENKSSRSGLRRTITTPCISYITSLGTRRHFQSFAFNHSDAYARNPKRAALVERYVRKFAARAGGADSKGAYSALCSTEHSSGSVHENHVLAEFRDKDGGHVATEHVSIPERNSKDDEEK